MNKITFFAIVATLSMSICIYPVFATELNEVDCNNITASAQVDDCVAKNKEASSGVLLNTLEEFKIRTKRIYFADQRLGENLINLVIKSQDAWLGYRDLSCKIEAFEIEENTPAYITTVNNCVIRMNSERIDFLKGL